MKAFAAMVDRASVAEAARRVERITEFMQIEGGCRAMALDPPSKQYGRAIIFMHERGRRRYLFRTRCYCGETLTR